MSPRPLICYLTQAYRVRGGHEAHLLHYATELRAFGFDTRILVLDALPREEHLFMRLLRERDIPLEAVRPPDDDPRLRLEWRVMSPVWSLAMRLRGRGVNREALMNRLADAHAARRLRRRLAQMRPDVIHILGRLASYAWPAIPPQRAVLHHGTEGHRDESWDTAELQSFQTFAGAAARNFAPGAGVAANLRQHFGIVRPIETIYTLCPDTPGAEVLAAAVRTAPPPVPRRFGIVCRMTPEKGLADLLDALRAWHAQRGPLDFLFAGGGALENDVRDAIQRAGWPRVRQQAVFDNPLEVLQEMDVFVHPSRSDAMPMAIAEALMAGRPCIVTRVGGIPDLVRHEQEGLLIEPGNTAQLTTAIARFAAMPATEYAAFAARARARYEAVCRPDRVAATVAAHYRAMFAERGSFQS